jgi:hypothetical protein
MNHLAIYRLYPQVVVIDGNNFLDAQNNQVIIDMDAVNAWVDPEAYKAQRVQEYPPIGDQLDALFKAGVFPAEMAAAIQAVKDKYPKGGAV